MFYPFYSFIYTPLSNYQKTCQYCHFFLIKIFKSAKDGIRFFTTSKYRVKIIVTIIWSVIYVLSLQFITVNSAQVNPVEAGNLFFSHIAPTLEKNQ